MPMMPMRAVRRSIFSSRSSLFMLGRVKGSDRDRDLVQLGARQFRKHGERDDFLRGAFGFRERSFLVSEVREAWLEMQRQRVVYRRTDLPCRQVLLELVPTLGADGVLVEDRDVLGIDERRHDLRNV